MKEKYIIQTVIMFGKVIEQEDPNNLDFSEDILTNTNDSCEYTIANCSIIETDDIDTVIEQKLNDLSI
jgi:hypothetical protein